MKESRDDLSLLDVLVLACVGVVLTAFSVLTTWGLLTDADARMTVAVVNGDVGAAIYFALFLSPLAPGLCLLWSALDEIRQRLGRGKNCTASAAEFLFLAGGLKLWLMSVPLAALVCFRFSDLIGQPVGQPSPAPDRVVPEVVTLVCFLLVTTWMLLAGWLIIQKSRSYKARDLSNRTRS